MNRTEFLNTHCDGSGPHSGSDVRLYPLGGGANEPLPENNYTRGVACCI